MSYAYKIDAPQLVAEERERSDEQLVLALRQHTSGEGAAAAIKCAQREGMLKALHNAMVLVRETFHPTSRPRLEVDEQAEDGVLFIFAVESRREATEAARLERELLRRVAQEPTTRPAQDHLLFYVASER